MKTVIFSILFGCILMTTSCGKQDTAPPLVEGMVVSGTLWDAPVGSGSRTGNPIPEGTQIRVYPNIVVLINEDGVKQIVPPDNITNLKVR